MSSLAFEDVRVTLVSALAWRAMAEVVRRHGDHVQLRVVQFHPGFSPDGVLRMELLQPKAPDAARWVEFNLGGPSGSYRTARGEGQATLGALLGGDPVSFIDVLGRDLGVPAPAGPLPSSTPMTIALRLIAGLLERLVFEPVPWRASLGVRGWNGGSHVAPWHSRVLGRTIVAGEWGFLPAVDHDRLTDLVLVHPSDDASYDPSMHPKSRTIAVDFRTGELFLLRCMQTTLLGRCDDLYDECSRNMRGLVRRIEAEVHS